MAFTVVIAPDSFKGSLTGQRVAAAIAAGWRSVRPHDRLVLKPQADGGEGTLDAIASSVAGSVIQAIGDVSGPDGRPTPGEWLELPGSVGVVELAQSSGLPLMRTPDALRATTRGLGQVIRAALDSGAHSLVIALGGSASTDGGAGALAALGLRLLDDRGIPVGDGGAELLRVSSIDRSGLSAPPPGGVTLLADVTSPLLGSAGAARVFGPQKGASEHDVRRLDSALEHFAAVFGGDPSRPGSGAAGGSGYGFATAWGATITPGADYVANVTNLDTSIATADLIITGEGRFDSQSLSGKLVGRVLASARAVRVPAAVITGEIAADSGTWSVSLTQLAESRDAAMADPERWLAAAGARAARELATN